MAVNGSQIERRRAGYDGDELRIIMGTLIDLDPDLVCSATGVLLIHRPDGTHQICVLSDGDTSEENIAGRLEHAVLHLRGRCRRCSAENRRRANGAR